MEYTELTGYPVSEGQLTTWTPTAPDEAWREDPRRLSWDHTDHLVGNDGGSWIGSVLRVPAAYDPEAVATALRAWLMRHEALRSSVRRDPGAGGGWKRITLDPGAVDIVPTDRGPGDAEANGAAIQSCFEAVSPTAWPHLVLTTVHEARTDGFMLAFGADHSVMDAYSQLAWFDEIVTLYERAAEGATLEELATWSVGSHLDHSERDRACGEAMHAEDPEVLRWRDFLHAPMGPRFPSFPDATLGVSPVTDGSLPQHSLNAWVADAQETSALGRSCRALGTGLQAGAVGALGLAAARRDVEELRFVMPMHTRQDPHHVAAVGWYVGCAPVSIDLRGITSSSEVIGRTLAGIDGGKDLVTLPLPRIVDLLGLGDHPHFVISYVDTRHVPGSDRWEEWQARALRSEAYADDEVYFWIIRSHHGLNVSARYPRTQEADATMDALVREMRRFLLELAGASTSPVARSEAGA